MFFCEHRGRKTKSTRARYSHSSILGIVWRILGWTPFGLLKFFLSLILVLQWQRINFQLGVEMSPLSILRNPRWRPKAIADGGHLGFLKTLNGDISTPSWKLILGPCTSRIKQEKNFIRPKGVQRKKAPSLPDYDTSYGPGTYHGEPVTAKIYFTWKIHNNNCIICVFECKFCTSEV